MASEPVGRRIREARLLQGLTKTDLAAQVGVSERSVERWETGQWLPNRDNLRDVAAALDVSVSWLFADPNGDDAPVETAA